MFSAGALTRPPEPAIAATRRFYSPTDRFSFSGFGGTMQDNYNRRGGVNSATPLNFIAGTANPYYLYGVLKDLSYNAGFDGDFMLNSAVSVFAEYSWERYDKSMSSRYRVPGGATPTPLNCGITDRAVTAPTTTGEARARIRAYFPVRL